MKRNKLLLPLALLLLLSGCKLKREVEISLPVATDQSEEEVLYGDVLDIETYEYDLASLAVGTVWEPDESWYEEFRTQVAAMWKVSVDELEEYYK